MKRLLPVAALLCMAANCEVDPNDCLPTEPCDDRIDPPDSIDEASCPAGTVYPSTATTQVFRFQVNEEDLAAIVDPNTAHDGRPDICVATDGLSISAILSVDGDKVGTIDISATAAGNWDLPTDGGALLNITYAGTDGTTASWASWTVGSLIVAELVDEVAFTVQNATSTNAAGDALVTSFQLQGATTP